MATSRLVEIILRAKDETKAAFASAQSKLEEINKTTTISIDKNKWFESATKDVNNKLKDYGITLGSNTMKMAVYAGAVSAAAAVIYKSAEAVYRFVDAQATLGDEMNDLNLRTGVSVESLSALEYSLKLAGGSSQDLETGIRTLSQRLNEARTGAGTAAADFARLGISTDDLVNGDGSLKSIEDILPLLADGFSRVTSQTERMDLATAMLGRGGLKLLPTLQQESAELRKQREEVERLGGVMSSDFARASDEFKDSQTRISVAWDGFKRSLAEPLLEPLTKAFNGLAESIGRYNRARAEANKSMYGSAVEIDPKVTAVDDAKKQIDAINARIAELAPGVAKRWAPATREVHYLNEQLKVLHDRLNQLRMEAGMAGVKERIAADAQAALSATGQFAKFEVYGPLDEVDAKRIADQSARELDKQIRNFPVPVAIAPPPKADVFKFRDDLEGMLRDIGGLDLEFGATPTPDGATLKEARKKTAEFMNRKVKQYDFADLNLDGMVTAWESATVTISGTFQSSMQSAFQNVLSGSQGLASAMVSIFANAISQIAAEFASAGIMSLLGLPIGGPFAALFGGGKSMASGNKSYSGGAGLTDLGAAINRASGAYAKGYI